MPVKPNFNPDYLYFVTTTAVKHIHLFRRDVIKRIIVDSLHHLRTTGKMKLFVFVIMPNHIHLIALFSKEHSLSDVMRDFKKFTARQIHRQFQAEENTKVLDILRKGRRECKAGVQSLGGWIRCARCVFNQVSTTKNGLHPSQSMPAAMETCAYA